MASFAERTGHRTTRTIIQSDSLDTETRTQLWNSLVILKTVLEKVREESYGRDSTEYEVLDAVWAWEFKRPRDERPSDGHVWHGIKTQVLSGEWYDVLDIIEAIIKYLNRNKTHNTGMLPEALTGAFNDCFEQYLVGYRFIGHEITPVDSTSEADAIVTALGDAITIEGARHSLERAVELLADRSAPDYPNSIKESISAVEAVVQKVTGKGTLGAGLGKLESAGLIIHPALKGAWSQMYGWTSDANGIRHAGIEAADADQTLAKYMLTSCSAFVSYLIEAGRKSDLL
ncbi:hypothetical protein F7P69_24285 [Cellulosimicrobium funkei]|nr:hypothetical protein [Cellulosimicrobium funkei]